MEKLQKPPESILFVSWCTPDDPCNIQISQQYTSCRGMWEQQSKPSNLGWTGLHPDLGAARLGLICPIQPASSCWIAYLRCEVSVAQWFRVSERWSEGQGFNPQQCQLIFFSLILIAKARVSVIFFSDHNYCTAGNFCQRQISSKRPSGNSLGFHFRQMCHRSFALRSFGRCLFVNFCLSSHSWTFLIPHLWYEKKFSQEFN